MSEDAPFDNPDEQRPPELGQFDPSTAEHVVDPSKVKLELYKTLSDWGSELVRSDRYINPDDPYREEFASNPNDPAMHSKWHQWGIIRHTIMTGRDLEEVVPEILKSRMEPTVAESRMGLLDEELDGISKWSLLTIAAPTHDYGKFTQRQYEMGSNGPQFNFEGHEAESGAIVRSWHDRFSKLGLTDKQIEYVAQCAELHYELGKLRSAAKKSDSGYSIAFTQTPDFREMADSITAQYPDMTREMGIFFIADSLAKTDVHTGIHALTDEENESLYSQMESEIASRNLSPSLLPAAKQVAVNVAAGIEYLKSLSDTRAA